MTTTATDDVTGPDDLNEPAGGQPAGPATGPRFGLLALTLAVVAGLLLGYAGGWLTPTLTRPGNTSPEAGFARDMSSHHAQAVEMGLIAFQRGSSQGIRQIGYDIATIQQGQIGTMQTWLDNWGLEPTGSEPPMAWMPDGAAAVKNGLMPGMATPEQMAELRAASGTELDALFCDLMIAHHLGGIHMADGIIEASDDRQVVELAENMKATQQAELNNLNQLRAEARAG
ncbi:DUF305 domain-containing protein [Plantactinospora sp. GCM10030261]|uniref:DUF305 domain-containing protein n=1 Tax=Plantactinospora sp. GCM10030261 TaxID=3273420 RepID=UPI0036207F5D